MHKKKILLVRNIKKRKIALGGKGEKQYVSSFGIFVTSSSKLRD